LIQEWYTREYLGKHFDRFLKSGMSLKDFMRLQEVLQEVLVQLQESRRFIESGYRNKTGRIPTKPREPREMFT